jgi:hypothetical protein
MLLMLAAEAISRGPNGPRADDLSSNRHPALSIYLSMISGQTLRVCPEGKPVSTFPDHALARRSLNIRVQLPERTA